MWFKELTGDGLPLTDLYIWKSAGSWHALMAIESLDAAPWRAAMFGITAVMFYSSGFLYSTVIKPTLTLLLAWNLELRKRLQAALFGLLLALMVIKLRSGRNFSVGPGRAIVALD